MKSASNKLILIILGTILLPIVVYSVYEISSVKEGEEVIEKVYRDQLDAIIFSVNQYSNDNLSSILNRIEGNLDENLEIIAPDPILDYSNFKVLLFKNLDSNKFKALSFRISPVKSEYLMALQDSLVNADPDILDRLIRYRTGGYRKIEPRGIIKFQGEYCQVVHAILSLNEHQILLTGLLSIEGFANNVLAPRLQQIAENELVITLGYKTHSDYIYVTDSLSHEVFFKKSMWAFPNVEVGISSKNKTVKELVEERMYYNLGASIILILLLIFGFSLVVRNFRREINLAQTKSDFVSNVSHELRTPLSLISMFAETLYLDRVPSLAKRKEYEEIILKETTRLTNIVNKILNFSQIENNRRTYHKTQHNLNDIVEELLHDYNFHMHQNGFTTSKTLTAELPDILVDKDAIYEAMVNLVDNGMKYSHEDRKSIFFRTGKRPDAIFIEVEDHGIGIPNEKIKQIFDKFYRITEGNLQYTRGAGLGLALVNHIMTAHNGDVEVESTVGKGSIFRLVFKTDSNG